MTDELKEQTASKIRVLGAELMATVTTLNAAQTSLCDVNTALAECLQAAKGTDQAAAVETLFGQYILAQVRAVETWRLTLLAQHLQAFGTPLAAQLPPLNSMGASRN